MIREAFALVSARDSELPESCRVFRAADAKQRYMPSDGTFAGRVLYVGPTKTVWVRTAGKRDWAIVSNDTLAAAYSGDSNVWTWLRTRGVKP
jgi:hypothetical protein